MVGKLVHINTLLRPLHPYLWVIEAPMVHYAYGRHYLSDIALLPRSIPMTGRPISKLFPFKVIVRINLVRSVAAGTVAVIVRVVWSTDA